MSTLRTPTRTGAVALLLLSSALACGGGERAADTAAATSTPAPATTAAPASADDAEDRVEVALDADSTLRRFGLDADDDDNKVIIKGTVATDAQKTLAQDIAARIATGLVVENRIRVKAGAGGTGAAPADVDEAEDRVEEAVEADSTLRGLDIDVDEEGGQIVLEGTVRTAAQKTLAEQVATRTAAGVTVVNRLRVQP